MKKKLKNNKYENEIKEKFVSNFLGEIETIQGFINNSWLNSSTARVVYCVFVNFISRQLINKRQFVNGRWENQEKCFIGFIF